MKFLCCLKCSDFGSMDEESKICKRCGSKEYVMVSGNITVGDIIDIKEISRDKAFVESMCNLHDTDPIEYQLKMSQFRTQVEQQKQAEESKKPHCPHCSSTNISSIGTGERVGSIAMWGIFSKKINKSFKCKNCGYTW